MSELIFESASVELGAARVLTDVNLTVQPGELVVLLGPNGAGKTSLLRAGLGFLPLSGGSVRLNGRDPRAWQPLERARLCAYLPQTQALAWSMRVRDVVALGRFAYGAGAGRLSSQDAEAVAKALEDCRLEVFARRRCDTLSGGELARVHMARALAGEARLLLADEPAGALDPLYAHEIMALIRAKVESGGAALVSLHDINLAARFADRIIALNRGQVVADGAPNEVLTPELMAQIYGVRAEVSRRPDGFMAVHVAEPV